MLLWILILNSIFTSHKRKIFLIALPMALADKPDVSFIFDVYSIRSFEIFSTKCFCMRFRIPFVSDYECALSEIEISGLFLLSNLTSTIQFGGCNLLIKWVINWHSSAHLFSDLNFNIYFGIYRLEWFLLGLKKLFSFLKKYLLDLQLINE